jgi:site-specific DNA recombinase
MIIGAAYLRCSDPRQDKSVEQQREVILQRAAQDGVHIPPENWFIDEGISGRAARKRHSYQALIRAAEAQRDHRKGRRRRAPQRQPIERLYVYAFSRIARNMTDCLRALAVLEEADIEVLSLTEQDGQDRSIRKLIRPILAWLAERYSEELSSSVRRGMRSEASKGLWVYGRPPFGYAVEDRHLVVTDETRPAFETVRRVFTLYLEGRDGWKRLAERLTREGVAPPVRQDNPRQRSPGTWTPKHVAQLVTNPVYCGHMVHKGEVVARDVHEAAVSDEDFEQAQALRKLKTRARKDGTRNGAHPIRMGERGIFTPWLRCGLCGGPVSITAGGGANGQRYYYYRCSSRASNKQCCSGLTIRVEKLDAALLDWIEAELLTPDNVQALVRSAVSRLNEQPDEVQAEREGLECRIADLDRRIRIAGAQVVEGVLSMDDARALNAPLIAQRETAKLKLAGLPARCVLPGLDEIDPGRFREAVLLAWRQRPLDERRDALDRLIDEITLSEGGAQVAYRVKDPSLGFRYQEPYGPPSGSWCRPMWDPVDRGR